MLNKKVVISLFVLPLILFVLVIVFSKPQKTWVQEGRLSTPAGLTLSNWASSTFISLTNTQEINQQIGHLAISATNITLSPVQIEQLQTTTYNFLMAYHMGDFESYAKFRFPVTNGAFIPQMTRWYLSRLEQAAPGKYPNLSINDPESVLRTWWNYSDAGGSENCTRCVHEVSFDNAKVYVEQVTELPKSLDYYVTSFPNVGYMSRNPSFAFDPSPKTLLEKDGKITIAVVSLIFHFSSDPPYPLYCRYYWVDHYQKWLPMELDCAYSDIKKWYYIF